MGRFTSPDPVIMKPNRLLDPQRLNLYSYTRNSPLTHVDPDGRDAIAVVFPDFKIQTGTRLGKIGGLGHAGVITIDSKGKTRYFEYGRYPGPEGSKAEPGRVRERSVVDVQMGKDGKPTAESMQNLLKDVSAKGGQNGRGQRAPAGVHSAANESFSSLAPLKETCGIQVPDVREYHRCDG
jgi:hypothetical protein